MSDTLALFNPADYDLSGATADELSKQLALLGRRRRKVHADDESSLESESEDEDTLQPPGPIDPEKCLVRHLLPSGHLASALPFPVRWKRSSCTAAHLQQEKGGWGDCGATVLSLAPAHTPVLQMMPP